MTNDQALFASCIITLCLMGFAAWVVSFGTKLFRLLSKPPKQQSPLPTYVMWARIDTKRSRCLPWEIVGQGNDGDGLWTTARWMYPLKTFDLIMLPKGDKP